MPPERVFVAASRHFVRSTNSQQFVNRGLAFLRRNVIELGVDIHVLFNGQVEIAGQSLRNYTNHSARRVRFFGDVVSGDTRLAGCDRNQRRHHANQRRLPCPVRPEQSEDLAFFHAERDIVDCGKVSVFLDDVLDLDGRRRRRIVNRLLQNVVGRGCARARGFIRLRIGSSLSWLLQAFALCALPSFHLLRRNQHFRRHARHERALGILETNFQHNGLDVALTPADVALRGESPSTPLKKTLPLVTVPPGRRTRSTSP